VYGEMVMKCPNCGSEGTEGRRFCANCGQELFRPTAQPMLQQVAMKCPNCGADNPDGKKFCGECGSAIPIAPRHVRVQKVPVPTKQPYQLRINVLCLVGAFLAVICLFLPWAVAHEKIGSDKAYLGAFDFNKSFLGIHLFPDNFRNAVTLFLIGTVVAFFCPVGGILQLLGSLAFLLTTVTTTSETIDLTYWIGAIIAPVSSVLVLGSLIYPLGVGYEAGKRDAISRLLSVSAVKSAKFG